MADFTVKREDEIDSGFGGAFKFVRHSLGITSFGAQVLQLPPNADGYPEHDHAGDGAEELYIPLEGSGEMRIGEESIALEPGVYVRVGAEETRKVVTGDSALKMLVVGATPGQVYEIPEFSIPKED